MGAADVLPGYRRGLSFMGDYAMVSLSPRTNPKRQRGRRYRSPSLTLRVGDGSLILGRGVYGRVIVTVLLPFSLLVVRIT